jgi:two-component system KDP operon response regulator KdpE
MESGLRILVVDDEKAIRRFLRGALAGYGYEIVEAATGQEALQAAADRHPAVIILDLGLPDMDGLEVTRRLRDWTHTPIIILSVREQESDKIAALDAGADDYLSKPFGVGELSARIRAALRRAGAQRGPEESVFVCASLHIDYARRAVKLDGQELALTPNEYDLLRVLTTNAGSVLTHRQLLKQVWGQAYEEEAHLLRVNISNLRHKLEKDPAQPEFIHTESGVGYRFRLP